MSESTNNGVSEAAGLPPRTLQRILFAPVDEIASRDLYVTVAQGRILTVDRLGVTVGAWGVVSTRTYFGRFPAAYYQRWTGVRTVTLRAKLMGRGRVRVFASDDIDRERIVGEIEVDSESLVEETLNLDLDRFLDGGFVWIDVEATDTPLTVREVTFEADDAVDRRLAVVICTYNRADDCIRTLQALVADGIAAGLVHDVFVIDQGTDLVRSRPGFAAVGEVLGERFHYIEQKNLGGAGGFTRGIYEVLREEDADRDIVLMDDDIVLEPETVLRMASFSARAINRVLVGAQMLYLYHPNLLHNSAEDADLQRLRAGVPVHAREQGIDLTRRLPYRWAEGGYNAWWTCLIPSSVVKEIGYPLPFFFQWDDIEFGLRARAHGIPTVTLTGSAVWHADFALKDRDDWSRYFSYRNSLIVGALHGDSVPKGAVKVLAKDIWQMIVSLQYGLAATTIAAIDGFLAGPESIRDGGSAAAQAARALRADYPDTVRHLPEEMVETGTFALPAVHAPRIVRRLPRTVVAKRMVYQILGLNRRVGKISSADNLWWHASLFRRVIVTDAALDAFRIREFNRRTAWRLTRETAAALLRLRRRGRRVTAQWRDAQSDLTTRATWTSIFDVRDKD